MGQPKPKERGRGAVLVVEDDPATREALVVFLRHEGYPAESVNDGQQALARLRDKKPPSLVLLDLMLPVMDGFEFRVQQLQDPTLAGIPVIVVSDLQYSYGGGLRIALSQALVARIDVGFSDEETGLVYLAFGQAS